MFAMRIRTPADAVAGAVMLLQVIPEDSLCLIFAGTPMALRCDVPNSADDVEAFAVRMRLLAGTYDLSMPVAVVFGTAPQARESLRALAVVRDVFTVQMLVRTDTVTCQEYRQEAAGEFSAGDSTPVDLYTHPFTAEGVMQGFCSLQTEARLRLDYTPAGTDAAGLTASPRWAAYAGSSAGVPDIADTLAEHVSALLCPLLADPSRLTNAQVCELAAAVHAHPIRDRLWLQITRDTALAYQELWRRVAVRCPRALAAEPLALAGFSAWLAGSGVAARIALEQAAACDVGHTLTWLVGGLLDTGMHPNIWEQLREDAAKKMAVSL